MRTLSLNRAFIIIAILIFTGQKAFTQNAFLFSPDATVPKNDTVVIRLHDQIGDIQWQKTHELNGSDNWLNINDATSDTLVFIADTTTYFRARVIAGHCDPYYSDTTHVSVYSLKEDVVIINPDELELISDSTELENGQYRYIGEQGDIEVGSVIVGTEGEGYMRRVTSMTVSNDTLELETEQATMEDVFDDFYLQDEIIITLDQNKKSMQGGKPISLDVLYLPPGAKFRSSGSGVNLSGIVIYSDDYITVGIEEGSINFEPRIEREFDFGIFTGLKSMRLVASGLIESDFDFYVQCTQQINYAKSILIGTFAVFVPVGPVPVTVILKFYLGFNANMEAEIYATAGYNSDYEVAFGAQYNKDANPKWQEIWERDADFTPHEPTYSIQGELTAKAYVKPELSVNIAGVAGTTLYVDPYVRFLGEFKNPPPYWYWELGAGIGGYLNFKVGLLGWNIVNYTNQLLNWDEILDSGTSEIESYLPVLTTTAVTNITLNSAKSGGNITSDGGKPVTARGVVWSTNPNPTLANNQGYTTNGTGTGVFVSNLTGLDENTSYYVRAYATNSNGTGYGNELNFVTLSTTLPSLTTTAVTNITTNSATSGGNISSDGGSSVTARGVVWDITPNPTLGSNQGFTTNGSGIGTFVSNLTGLSPYTLYYVRAYATNSNGTAYGNELNFTTLGALPTLTTATVTNITDNSATSGGNITSDGGSSVTARGVVWNTTPNPTLGSNLGYTTNGTGIGVFVSNLTGLSPNTLYYVRAYATNSNGTAYGNELSFTTLNSSGCGSVTFTYNGITVTYGSVISANNRCWLDRNLGATQVATSSTDAAAYGDLFQWGRLDDGHQVRTSPTTTTLSNSDVPGHGNFILAVMWPSDWRSPQNNNLWQGVNGTNNVCPDGYRLPTLAEWDTERLSWSSNNAEGAFSSPLKLPMPGDRSYAGGGLNGVGWYGHYWSSTIYYSDSHFLNFGSSYAAMDYMFRAVGASVRCLKD